MTTLTLQAAAAVQSGTTTLDFIEGIHACEDAYLLGRTVIAGVDFHATFLRVRYDDGYQTIDAEPGSVAADLWDDLCHLDEAAFRTIQVPGYPGKWILYLQPFGAN